jgi:predicted lipoprotein with Yx(FWY)xxD motif
MRKLLIAASLAAAVLAVAACASSSSSPASSAPSTTPASSAPSTTPAAGTSSSPSASTLAERTISGTEVLTNSAGYTLYWFALDTSTTSKCTGTCVSYWPPLKGPVTAGSGVTGTVGVITRSDGTTQATYDGHPLYTYSGDSAPGQNNGNGKNLSGGVWHEVTVSGTAPVSSTPSSSSGGGYGY